MEQAVQAAGICVTGAILALVVKRGSPEAALLLTLAAAAAVLVSLGEPLRDLLAFWKDLGQRSGVSEELLTPLYKTVGIALVVKVGGSLCRDAGEAALASVVETAGSVCALLVSVPLLEAVVSLLEEML